MMKSRQSGTGAYIPTQFSSQPADFRQNTKHVQATGHNSRFGWVCGILANIVIFPYGCLYFAWGRKKPRQPAH